MPLVITEITPEAAFEGVLTVKEELKLVNVNNLSNNTSRTRPDNVMEFATMEADRIFISLDGVGLKVEG
ncbi:MAG: hypothetical protein IT249_00875 [Chitinophagaceae bacterium]|nr:hypothetical protein [Chitinophagaceae bacterium]